MLRNGVQVPQLGCGTAVFSDIGPEQKNNSADFAAMIVENAVESGVRPLLIDTAHMYYNEKQLGQELNKHLGNGSIAREDLFVVSKIAHFNVDGIPPHTECSYVEDESLDAYTYASADIDRCIARLGVGALDLCLIHWPGRPGNTDEAAAIVKRAAIWRALEDAYDAKKCRAIGVSNFTIKHLSALDKTARIQPMVNQLEIHPYLPQVELAGNCRERGMHVMAYCPLGSGVCSILEDATIAEIANIHQTSPGAIVLAWHVQRGITPVPKSTTPHRIKKNLTLPQFTLSASDMRAINLLGAKDIRVCPDISTIL